MSISRKVMLLGEIGVGKTSIVQRLVFDRFELSYKPTIGVDVYRYDVPPGPGRDQMSLIVWDTDGNFGEAIFKHVYLKQASAAIVIGDITRRDTLETMIRLGQGFREALPGRHVSFVLNKADLLGSTRSIELPDALVKFGIEPYLTSAKTGENVEKAFIEAADAISRRGQ
jgi:small GTP-binding protein